VPSVDASPAGTSGSNGTKKERNSMRQEIAILFSGYMAGVVFGSMMSVTIYRLLEKSGKLGPFACIKPDQNSEEVAQ
jgi:hypothetical protein